MGHLSDEVATANSPLTSVLLVQPERDDREMYEAFLRYRRFRPVVVSIAVDALRVASRADVIVTGILLPGSMDGIELVRRLKADHRTRRIPTIVLTVCVWPHDQARAWAAGCDAFLAKPCLPDRLIAEIQRVMSESHPQPMSALSRARCRDVAPDPTERRAS
jgi:CheY-like chemotaxis protein